MHLDVLCQLFWCSNWSVIRRSKYPLLVQNGLTCQTKKWGSWFVSVGMVYCDMKSFVVFLVIDKMRILQFRSKQYLFFFVYHSTNNSTIFQILRVYVHPGFDFSHQPFQSFKFHHTDTQSSIYLSFCRLIIKTNRKHVSESSDGLID